MKIFDFITSCSVVILFALATSPLVSGADFINPSSFNIVVIIPAPPQPGSAEAKTDSGYLKNARATSDPEQIDKAITASHDSAFDYSETLGSWFNSRDLPKTSALFDEITKEAKGAIDLAKNHFERTRPIYWIETGDPEKSDGYSYPSGHTTRAFLWADLLANAFPDMQKQLHLQARKKAWYRVILGRHYPADVRAGKIYGKYLATQFLKSPEFQKQWIGVKAEMQAARSKAASHPG